MSARKVYLVKAYDKRALDDQQNFLDINFDTKWHNSLQYYFDAWQPRFAKNNTIELMLHEYENCGATNGIEMLIKPDKYILKTYNESGYGPSFILREGPLGELDEVLSAFKPARYDLS